MTEPSDRRSRKRLALRETISDIATQLFLERGFDNVTVDEIAKAADVGRMTVFNHFPRKEDLLFDRDEEAREILRDALRRRAPGLSPIETLRLLVHRLIAAGTPYLQFSRVSRGFIETVEASETLKARARAIRDELAEEMTIALAGCVGRDSADSDARLAGALLLATWSEAFLQAHRIFREKENGEEANAVFLAILDKGCLGLKAALADTPYA